MNKRALRFIFAVIIFASVTFAISASGFVTEKPNEVKPFLPDIVTQFPDVRDVALSPTGNEAYFTIQSYANEISAVVFVTLVDETWSQPKVASFSGRFTDMEPYFSTDGLRMYFVSNRPLQSTDSATKDFDIWYVERKSPTAAWSAPVNMGAPVNSIANEFFPSVSTSGNIYFTCDGVGSKGRDDIFTCAYENGKYQQRVSLSDSINSEGMEFNAFVAPDESYLIYTCYNRKGDFGSGDLYISYRKNGKWTAGKNMGSAYNSKQMEYCPYVDTRNGVLYFTSRRNKVNSSFTSEQTVEQLLQEMNRYENGKSRLYQVEYPSLMIDN